MDIIISFFSPYELKARFFPALLILAPLFLTVVIWYPELIELESSIFTIVVLVIILFFFAKLSRELGVKKQKVLLKKWGNFPSTIMLRHRDNTIDAATKLRYHRYLRTNIEGLELPTPEEELNNPDFYEDQYSSAIKWLLEKTRDKNKYDLLFQDNINFGFSRNMFGVKYMGIVFCFLAILININGIYQTYNFNLAEIELKIWLSNLISLIFLLLWVFFVKESWVKNSAVAYARTLLSTCEEIKN
jgi:hypothetical protein